MSKRLAAVALVTASLATSAQPTPAPALDRARCARKVSITLTGKSASDALASTDTPQAEIDALLRSEDFVERLSRYVNSRFNEEPGADPAEDAAYHLTRHVLTNNLPWRALFLGRFRVDLVNKAGRVVDDPAGLGYFRSPAWLSRYAGNEEDGVKLATAYRILNNTTGLSLTAAVIVPGLDASSDGRRNAACSGCHYDAWFALDRVASVLTRRVGTGAQMRFEPPTGGPQRVLDGRLVSDDEELVTALVASPDFEFNTCRIAFGFVFGRKELACEGPLFDRCIDAFRAQGTIQAAIATLMKDPSFCR